jgi:hypothetical protein
MNLENYFVNVDGLLIIPVVKIAICKESQRFFPAAVFAFQKKHNSEHSTQLKATLPSRSTLSLEF